ncbi:SorB family sulfite dehydrogenase c-type cytochrome subunit [Methylobacterium trifolii]|uniref:Sulfite:cytochrome C oxidoreductase subunit B n=1 Tax=Methylobacterium trifolii TaxID=1003092 RepID=A0ABQ4TRW4_9HYPH|nr:cytochrome c [Methylobacterium trifolii]GJE58036.1 hypothetical protein MPOCJGCO_0113 [Methylobacterium trifolii]
MTTHVLAAVAALAVVTVGSAAAAPRDYVLPEEMAQFRPGRGDKAGHAAAQANCLTCHSADYVAMQPPGKGAAFWEAEVTKMIKVYHAPIGEADAKAISAYLAATY